MFEHFKPIMQNGERYVVVENGKPEYVLMRFQDYVFMAAGKRSEGTSSRVGERRNPWERANVEFADVGGDPTIPHDEAELSGDPIPPPVDPTSVRLEDLAL